MGVPFLGRMPIYQPIREGGDAGRPIVTTEPDSPAGRALFAVAEQAAAQISIASYTPADHPAHGGALRRLQADGLFGSSASGVI